MADQEFRRSWRCGPGACDEALEEFRRFGGSVLGGPSEGTLTASTPLGPVEGRYRFDGEELLVIVTVKPALLPVEMIWSRIDRICGPPVSRA